MVTAHTSNAAGQRAIVLGAGAPRLRSGATRSGWLRFSVVVLLVGVVVALCVYPFVPYTVHHWGDGQCARRIDT